MYKTISHLTLVALTIFLSACHTTEETKHNGQSVLKDESNQFKILRMAHRMKENGDYQTALKFYYQAHNQEEQTPEVVFGISYCLAKTGQYFEAIDTLKTFNATYPNHPEIDIEMGKVYLESQEPRQCIQHFSAALKQHPDNITVLNGLGVCHDLEKKHDIAQSYYLKALEINPKATHVSSNLALSYAFSHDKIDQGISMLERIANTSHAKPKDRQNLALAYGLAGRMDKAAEVFSIDLNDQEVENNLTYIRQLKKQSTSSHPNADIEMQPLSPTSPSKTGGQPSASKRKKKIHTIVQSITSSNEASTTPSHAYHEVSNPSPTKRTADAFMKHSEEKATWKSGDARQGDQSLQNLDHLNDSMNDLSLLEVEALLM